jgi:hypothetical protein
VSENPRKIPPPYPLLPCPFCGAAGVVVLQEFKNGFGRIKQVEVYIGGDRGTLCLISPGTYHRSDETSDQTHLAEFVERWTRIACERWNSRIVDAKAL